MAKSPASHAAARFIACRWQVDHGISIEEAGWHQLESAAHDWLDGEVLRAYRMMQAEDVPQDDIGILDRTIRFDPSLGASLLRTAFRGLQVMLVDLLRCGTGGLE